MEFLRKLWPFSFETKSVSDLVFKTIVYVIIASLFSILMGVVKDVIVLNVIMYILGSVCDVYVFIGIVVLFLSYFKILK